MPAKVSGTTGMPAVEALTASVAAGLAGGRVRDAVGAAVGARSPGETRTPMPSVPAGTAKPQSRSSAAWSAARKGVFSVSMTLTTSRRPSRSAAVTKVCRAASVKPVFPPRHARVGRQQRVLALDLVARRASLDRRASAPSGWPARRRWRGRRSGHGRSARGRRGTRTARRRRVRTASPPPCRRRRGPRRSRSSPPPSRPRRRPPGPARSPRRCPTAGSAPGTGARTGYWPPATRPDPAALDALVLGGAHDDPGRVQQRAPGSAGSGSSACSPGSSGRAGRGRRGRRRCRASATSQPLAADARRAAAARRRRRRQPRVSSRPRRRCARPGRIPEVGGPGTVTSGSGPTGRRSGADGAAARRGGGADEQCQQRREQARGQPRARSPSPHVAER